MKACIYYIKIFFLILFNSIIDLLSYIGSKTRKGIVFIFSKLKWLFTKLIYVLILLGNKIKIVVPIIGRKIKNGSCKIGSGFKFIGFAISDSYINLKYKLFIAYLKHKEKPPKYPEVYRGEEIKEEEIKTEEIEKPQEESITEEDKTDEDSKKEEVIEKESEVESTSEDITKEEKDSDEVEDESLPEEVVENSIVEQPIDDNEKIIIKESPITLRKVVKFTFVFLSWLLTVGLATACIVIAENTFLGLDLNRPFLYNIDLLTREQAQLLILIGIFFTLVAASELLVFLFRFITCRPILQRKLFSDFTIGIMCSYFTGMCFVIREEIKVALESESIKHIELLTNIEKVLPFIAIVFFLFGSIKLMVAFNDIFEKEKINDK